MRAVAVRRVLGVFAAAQKGRLAVFCGESQGAKACALMAAIAIGLLFGLAARAPEIGLSRLYRHGERGFLGDVGRVGHGASLELKRQFDLFLALIKPETISCP